MKKLLCLVLALTMLMSLALISPAAAEDWKFERKIEIVCPWGLGGGADSTIRPMATLLQQKLGVPVEVRNETGAGGVTGIEYTYKQPADGYTFMLGTQSLFIQDMLGNTSMNFKTEMECVDVLVHSINMLVGSKKQLDKYGIHNFTELKEYAAAHPYEVSVGMLTATGVDGMCFEIATEGLSLNMVQYGGGAEVNADLAGGHCDLAVGGYDDMSGVIESGDIVPLLVFCEHRLRWASIPLPVPGAASLPRRAPRRAPSTRWLPPSKSAARTPAGRSSCTMPPMTSALCPPPAKS